MMMIDLISIVKILITLFFRSKYPYLFSALSLCLLAPSVRSQEMLIRGRIILDPATSAGSRSVALMHAGDTSILQTTLTDSTGYFCFVKQQPGVYAIRASVTGYRQVNSTPVYLARGAANPFTVIEMVLFARVLDAVKVVARRPFFEKKADRTIINVESLLANAGSNALEVLELAPGVKVAGDVVSINGRQGVMIYIDDKPSNLQGADLAGYLRSLPSGVLDKIEILSNPPAGYDASGNGGIINLRLKKFRNRGFSGNLSSENIRGRRTRLLQSANLSLCMSKIHLYSNISYYNGEGSAVVNSKREYERSVLRDLHTLDEVMTIHNPNHSFNIKAGMDWMISSAATFNVEITDFSRQLGESTIIDSRQSYFTGADSLTSGLNSLKNHARNFNVYTGFKYVYDTTGRQWTADAMYTGYDLQQTIRNLNDIAGVNGNVKSTEQSSGDLSDLIRIISLRTDYKHPLKRDLLIEAGYKYNRVRTDNEGLYDHLYNGIPFSSNGSAFSYTEAVHAFYGNSSMQLKRFEIQAGLRVEQTRSASELYGARGFRYARNYTNIFPTAFLTWKIDPTGLRRLNIAYGKRIDRPGYASLDPAMIMRDRYTYSTGNPYLLPSSAQNLELSYDLKSNFTITAFYSQSKNEINEVIELRADTSYRVPMNTGRTTSKGVSMSGSFNICRGWRVNINMLYHYKQLKVIVNSNQVVSSNHYVTGTLTQQFDFGKGWNAELLMDYSSPELQPQTRRSAVWFAQGGVAKKIWHEKGIIRLNVRDIFYTRVDRQEYLYAEGWRGYDDRKWDTRSITLAFTYRFSKGVNQGQQKRNGPDDGRLEK